MHGLDFARRSPSQFLINLIRQKEPCGNSAAPFPPAPSTCKNSHWSPLLQFLRGIRHKQHNHNGRTFVVERLPEEEPSPPPHVLLLWAQRRVRRPLPADAGPFDKEWVNEPQWPAPDTHSMHYVTPDSE